MNRLAHPPACGRLVMLTKRDVEDVHRLLGMLVSGSSSEAVVVAGLPQPVTRKAILQAALDEIADRKRRSELLPEGMFGEPAWEVLLTLFAHHQGVRFTLARLTRDLGVAPTTVLRWLAYLEDRNLITRKPHPTDQRSVFMELTDTAIDALDVYFSVKLSRPD